MKFALCATRTKISRALSADEVGLYVSNDIRLYMVVILCEMEL